MSNQLESLKQWIHDMAELIETNAEPDPQHIASFLHDPHLPTQLIDIISTLEDEQTEKERSYYSACIFALDICVAQLQAAQESGHKHAGKMLEQLMHYLAQIINNGKHSLSFWLPILNAFYDVHVELSDELRDAYLDLAGQDDDFMEENPGNHLDAIRDMIAELAELSVFDIAENFFAQSHAMPAEFFSDLVVDLYSIEEGQDIALLALLHPNPEVRGMVIATIEQIISSVILSSASLSRLQTIIGWYPSAYHDQLNRWIKIQRKKGVVFNKESKVQAIRIKASEVDGSGAQGIFIHLRKGRKNQLCGLLLKHDMGIKDAWITPLMNMAEINKYYDDAFDESVTLRDVDGDYLSLIVNHFLALTITKGSMPDLHLLEMQELLGLHFQPQLLDINDIIENLSVQIIPFTPDVITVSFKRSKTWLNTKSFSESWYVENSNIDKLVNRCSSFVDGVKLCVIEDAIAAVLEQEMEKNRDKWLFHFLWVTLWIKSHARKNEKVWQDSFFVAYAIHSGQPLAEIPIMHEITKQTVINSIETMADRRTHLNRE